jgi:hypothetical protein
MISARERPMALWLGVGKRLSLREQHTRQRERDERAFLFDSDFSLVAEFEREEWECPSLPVAPDRDVAKIS